MTPRTLSPAGSYFIKCREAPNGHPVLKAYADTGGIPTVGWGHTGPEVRLGDMWSLERCQLAFDTDTGHAVRWVNDYVSVPITQNQFDALVSLAYNIGGGAFANSTVRRELQAGNVQAAADAILMWDKGHVDGVLTTLPGLHNRRVLERALFLGQPLGVTVSDNESSTIIKSVPAGSQASGAAVGQALVAASGLVSPFLPAAIKVLGGLLPAVAKEFGGTEVSDRNLKLAAAAVQTVQDAVGAANPIEAVDRVQRDPQALQRASDALEAAGFGLSDVGGGIPAARKASGEAGDWWRQPAPWVTAALLPLVYFVVWQVMTGEGWSSEVRSMVVAAIVTGLLGAVTGYWLGTSYGSQRKTDMLAGKG